ncbi:MAG: hypothetical protein AAB646_00490 [Patescibacteria group bacterium]
MRAFKESSGSFFDELKKRSKQSKAYTSHQLIGLEIAVILRDWKHRGLYIKLAKEHDAIKLLSAAKSIAENKNIKNAGAYFMKIIRDIK